jgi:hypothetical protein
MASFYVARTSISDDLWNVNNRELGIVLSGGALFRVGFFAVINVYKAFFCFVYVLINH